MGTCKHLIAGICDLSRQLCGQYGIDAAPRPHATACEFCTNKADPPRSLNEVIVSLMIAAARTSPAVYQQIMRDHGHRLQKAGPVTSSGRLQAIEQGSGPGSELWRLLSELGIRHKPTCSCLSLAERMNAWGPDGCRSARAEIVAGMKANAREYGWLDVARAAFNAVTSNGIAWRLDLGDIYGSLVDEAIKRSETIAASPPIDVVLPLGPGSRHNDIELRYALRAIRQHAVGLRRIVVIGAIPTWLVQTDTLRLIFLPEFSANKAARIALKFRWAFQHSDVTDTVAMWNDDYLMLRDQDIRTIPPIYRGQLYRPNATRGWRRLLHHTAETLTAAAYGARHFDIHVPILYERRRFLDMSDWWDRSAKDPIGLVAKSLYGNIHCADTAVRGRDCKLQADWQRRIDGHKVTQRWVLSYGDGALTTGFAKWMQERFPESAPWEKQTTPARKVKPCC